jgi:hypothetical protein
MITGILADQNAAELKYRGYSWRAPSMPPYTPLSGWAVSVFFSKVPGRSQYS